MSINFLISEDFKSTSFQVAILAEVDDRMIEMAFQYGRNVGLAFQLVDDLLDFVASSEALGKPTAADLKLGLATAPVLFACEQVSKSCIMLIDRGFHQRKDLNRLLFSVIWTIAVSGIKRDDYAPFSRTRRRQEGFRISAQVQRSRADKILGEETLRGGQQDRTILR